MCTLRRHIVEPQDSRCMKKELRISLSVFYYAVKVTRRTGHLHRHWTSQPDERVRIPTVICPLRNVMLYRIVSKYFLDIYHLASEGVPRGYKEHSTVVLIAEPFQGSCFEQTSSLLFKINYAERAEDLPHHVQTDPVKSGLVMSRFVPALAYHRLSLTWSRTF